MKDSIQKKCDRCEAEFTLYKQDYCPKAQRRGWWQNRNYCSNSCALKAQGDRFKDVQLQQGEYIEKTCPFCHSDFKIYKAQYSQSTHRDGRWKKRIYCSRSCSLKSSMAQRKDGSYPWLEEELELLLKWIGSKPLNLIFREWNKTARKKKWVERSPNALKVKATRLMMEQNSTVKCYEDNWDSRKLSRLLGVQEDKVRSWRRRGIIAYTKLSSNQTAISRKHLKEFALEHPEELGGIEPKKLRKVLKDSKLVRSILEVAHNAPKNGRKMTIVRLDTGDVYPSARNAACAIAPEMGCIEKTAKSNILRVAKKDTPMKNGMDFYQLDYPVFWCPLDIRDEFNLLAGKILYELYLDICEVTGFQKQSCLIVAARMAVKIALMAFQMKEYYLVKQYNTDRSKEAIAEFWQKLFLDKLIYVFNMQGGLIFQKVNYILKKRIFKNCWAIVNGDKFLAEEYAQDFANYYIRKETEKFYRNSYLPLNYSASNRLQYADMWASIYNSLNIYIWIGKEENGTRRKIPWINICFIHFCRTNSINQLADGKTVALNEEWKEHSSKSDGESELDLLLANAQEIYDETTFEQLSMFVALKLEEASDREIADCLNINISAIPKIISQLQKCV